MLPYIYTHSPETVHQFPSYSLPTPTFSPYPFGPLCLECHSVSTYKYPGLLKYKLKESLLTTSPTTCVGWANLSRLGTFDKFFKPHHCPQSQFKSLGIRGVGVGHRRNLANHSSSLGGPDWFEKWTYEAQQKSNAVLIPPLLHLAQWQQHNFFYFQTWIFKQFNNCLKLFKQFNNNCLKLFKQ